MRTLIVSKDGWELSTEMVMDWLIYFGVEPVRLNGDVFEIDQQPFTINFSNGSQNIKIDTDNLLAGDIDSIWIRRWSNEYAKSQLDQTIDPKLLIEILNNQKQDQSIIREFVLEFVEQSSKRLLTKPNKTTINKLVALRTAQKVGLDVPETIITNDKKELINFYYSNHGQVVSKDISTALAGFYKGEQCFMYATKITEETINKLPEKFPASLFQGYVCKQFEIRAFFLNSKIYSMAILSQSNKQTAVDFRQYSYSKPNRTIPYQLPTSIENKLCEFMNILDYQTGSFDIIKTPDESYVFLEMNPVGQFGMISDPCNYPIEHDIAKYLSADEK